MLATHRHESILGGSRVERMLSHAAELRVSALDPASPFGGLAEPTYARQCTVARRSTEANSRTELSAVSLIAAWKEVTVEQMARDLLGMTAQQRTQLREQYAGQ